MLWVNFLLGEFSDRDITTLSYDEKDRIPQLTFEVKDSKVIGKYLLTYGKINLVVQKSIGTKQPPEMRESYQVLLSKINEFINSISYDYYLPLIFDDGLTLVNFLKAINLKITDTTDNPVDQLVFKIRELSYVLGFKVFFIMNLYDYFTPNEIESIHKELNSLEIKMINISSHRNKCKINNEFIVDIDEDLAEIHIGEDE